jgi:hypothetical protein
MQPVTRSELRFHYGQASANELQEVIDTVLVELRDESSEAAEQARESGLDSHILADAKVSVSEDQGVDAVATTIVVGIIVQLGSHITKQFWDEVIWPRVRRRLGAKAVGDKIE